jgi:hypothetical protein
MRSIRPAAAASAVALALLGSTALAQYPYPGPVPGGVPYGAAQPYPPGVPGPYPPPPGPYGPYGPMPGAGPYLPPPGMGPYGPYPTDPMGMGPYGPLPADPMAWGQQGAPLALPGAGPYGQPPTDPSQQGAGSGGTYAVPGVPGQPGAPGPQGAPGQAPPGMPPMANAPGQLPPGSSTTPPANAGVGGVAVGPSGVASASGTNQWSNLPLPPTAGGVSTDTIRFLAVGESGFAFDPTPVRIPVEQPITWVNTSTAIINIASEDGSSFDSGPLAPGESYTYVPSLIGSIPYRDKLHPWVRGMLVATARR